MKKILTLVRKDLGELWSSRNLMVTFFLFSALSWYYFAWMSYDFARFCEQRGETRVTIENYWQYNVDLSLIRDILSFNFFLLLFFLPYLLLSLLSEEKKQQWRSYFTSYRISGKQYLTAKALLQLLLVALFTGSSVLIQYLAIRAAVDEPLNHLYFISTYFMTVIFLVMILTLSAFTFFRMDSLLKGLVTTYVVLIFFWLVHIPLENQPGLIPALFQEISFSYRVEKIMEGLFRLRDLAYFIFIIIFLNFATYQSLKKQKL